MCVCSLLSFDGCVCMRQTGRKGHRERGGGWGDGRERETLRVCVCVCVRACVRACVHACVRTCVRACVRVVCVYTSTRVTLQI